MYELFEATIDLLEKGNKVSVKWDCGGDEAIMTVYIDGKQLPFEDGYGQRLEIYLMNKLDLPDVGEFEMKGGGEILEEDNKIYFVYKSIIKAYEEYSDDYSTSEWVEVNEIDEDNTGKKELFTD